MASENLCFFAWCAIGELFDPAVHAIRPDGSRVWDDRPLTVVVKHSEWGRRTASVDFGVSLGGSLLEGREACHISALIDGQVRHLFYGPVTKSANGVRARRTVAEFESKHPLDIQLQADLLQGVVNNPVLYIPEIEKAKDLLDADVILKATTLQIEFDKAGVPHLCSIFGDPTRLKVLPPGRIVMDSIEPTFEAAPPREAVVDLVLEGTQREAGYIDLSEDIQAEIDRIGQHYGLPAYGANFTLTPDFMKQWPKHGDSLGDSYVVISSGVYPVDGPGHRPKIGSARPRVMASEPTQDVAGLPEDPSHYGAETTQVEMDSTGFSMPQLYLFGVISKPRKERVRIVVPFKGQELVPDNAEPTYIELAAQALMDDPTVEEWKQGEEYGAGSRAKGSGMVFQSNVNQEGRQSLLQDVNDYDPFSVTLGTELWSPVLYTNAPIPDPSTSQMALSPFGRRAIQYAVRRAIATLGYAARAVTEPAKIAIEDAWDLDTRSTLRLEGSIFNGFRVEGKVAEISMAFDASGETAAEISLAVAIGSGETDDEWDDTGDDGEPQEPGADYPVATEGGRWDLVRYQAPFYFVDPVQPSFNIRIDWLGCEQQWAISHPGQFVWNPYGTIPGPNGQYPARSVRFVNGVYNDEGKIQGAQEWLEKYNTEIAITTPSGDGADAGEVQVYVPVTYGWRGPKQIQL